MTSLTDAAQQVDELESRHNEVLDVFADIDATTLSYKRELLSQAQVLYNELEVLHQEILLRLHQAKKISVLLSLIAQHEEFVPLQKKVNSSQHEQYITTRRFKKELSSRK